MYGEDPYYLAVCHNRIDVLEAVLDIKNENKWNALHATVMYRGLDMINAFSDNDIHRHGHAQDKDNKTPLHWAFYKCDAVVALILLEKGCWKLYNGEDKPLLLHMTVEAFAFDRKASPYLKWLDLIQWLRGPGGIDPTVEDSKGETASDLYDKWDVLDELFRKTLREIG